MSNSLIQKAQLLEWAQAGDEDCMFKLAKLCRDEGNIAEADEWLAKSAEAKNFFAMKEYAARLREKGNVAEAIDLYKEIVEWTCDVEALEAVVDLCEKDAETLNFVLDKINSMFNGIYLQGDQIWQRMFVFGTRRYNECTIQTLQAVERRRIASRIRKLLANN